MSCSQLAHTDSSLAGNSKFRIFKILQISPETEVELSRIADLKEFAMKGSVVVREDQEGDAFYSVSAVASLLPARQMLRLH